MIDFKKENGPQSYERLYAEFYNLIDPRLRALLLELADWVERKFAKNLVVTCLNRTKAENDQVGGVNYSAHLVGRAADIRSVVFVDAEIRELIEYVRMVWATSYIYAIHHDSGAGPHIHINIRRSHHSKDWSKIDV